MGFTPAEVDGMSYPQYRAALEGYMKVHSKASDAPTREDLERALADEANRTLH